MSSLCTMTNSLWSTIAEIIVGNWRICCVKTERVLYFIENLGGTAETSP